MAFRRAASQIKSMTMDFGGAHTGKACTFTDIDSGETWTVSAEALAEGFTLTMPEPYSSRVLLYHFD